VYAVVREENIKEINPIVTSEEKRESVNVDVVQYSRANMILKKDL